MTKQLSPSTWNLARIGSLVALLGFMIWVLQRSGWNLYVGIWLLVVGQAVYMVTKSIRKLSAAKLDEDNRQSEFGVLQIECVFATIVALGIFLVYVRR